MYPRPAIRGHRGQGVGPGFTLVELLVVLVIMGFALAVVPVSMVKLYDGMQYRSAIGDVLTGLKAARNEAVKRGRSVAFSVDVQTRRVDIGDSKSFVLPDSLDLGLIVAQREIQGERGSIRFYPDGSSTGGRVQLSMEGHTLDVDIEWLTGRIRVLGDAS